MPTPEASILLKIIQHNIYPRAGNNMEPSNILLVALFCIWKKIQVNCMSFINWWCITWLRTPKIMEE